MGIEIRNIFFVSLLFSIIAVMFVDYWVSGFGLGICLFLFLLFISRFGSTVPVLELMMLIASLQWVLGAFIAYRVDYYHFKYFMYVDESTYMDIVVPGMVFFIIGISMINYTNLSISINQKISKIANEFPQLAYYLIFIGLVIPLLGEYLPNTLKFVFYLLSGFKYVGIALLLFKNNDNIKWGMFIFIMALTLLESMRKGLFHELLLWSALLSTFIAMRYQWSFFRKFMLVICGIVFAFLLQSIKNQYRVYLENSENTQNRISVFFDLLSDQLTSIQSTTNESELGFINVRLNQGWIISSIFYYVPQYEPYAEGATITEAIRASIIPRFLDPGKKIAGGEENFERFTGLYIRSDTSMGTSILGEAYGNFGKVGSWIFMLIWGGVLSYGFKKLVKYGEKYPMAFLFIPLIFLQVVKAETELYVVLNHFVKSILLVFLFLWGSRKFLQWKI